MDVADPPTVDELDADRVLARVSHDLFGASPASARIGRFVLLDKLGAGGMGVVYSAFDPQLDRRVAIKLVHAGGGPDEAAEAGLLREARTLAKLSHQNVVTVHEAGTARGRVFLAMEMVVGESLERWIATEPPWPEVVRVFADAGRGLHAAHEAGLVHRDFKPSNAVLRDDGRVIVLDFGLAHAVEEEHAPDTDASLGRTTVTRGIVGTPLYMAPEQLRGDAATAASDQFSFCVSLHQALHGVHPFPATSLGQLLERASQPPARAPGGSAAPSWLDAVVRRGLSADPGARYPSMAALVEALAGPPRRWWRRPAVWTAGVLVGGGAYGLVTAPGRGDAVAPCRGGEDRVATTWNEGRRDAVREAFEATSLPYADDALVRSMTAIDRYAHDWARAHDEACAATRIRGEQSEALLDLRVACLGERLGELDGLVGVFEEADAKVVERAATAVSVLPPLDACANATRLLAADDALTPAQAEVRAARLARLARARAEQTAGRDAASAPIIDEVLEEVGEDGDRRVRQRAHYLMAGVLERRGKFEAAATAAQTALWHATALRDPMQQAQSASKLVTILGGRLHAFERGRDYGSLSRSVIASLGDDPELLGVLESGLGNLARAQGRYDEALAHKERALALRAEGLGPEDPRLAGLHDGIGVMLLKMGRSAEALDHHLVALRIHDASLGDLHPKTGHTHNHLGSTLLRMGRSREAVEEFTEARRIWSASLPVDHHKLGIIANNFGNAYTVLGQHDDALASYLEAVRIWTKTRGPDDRLVAISFGNIAGVHAREDRFEQSRDAAREALRIFEATVGREHPDTTIPRLNLAWAQVALGDHEDALRQAELAVQLAAKHLGKEHEYYAQALVRRGMALIGLGRAREAVAPLEQAVAAYDRAKGRAGDRGDAAEQLARALEATGDDPERVASLRARVESLRASG